MAIRLCFLAFIFPLAVLLADAASDSEIFDLLPEGFPFDERGSLIRSTIFQSAHQSDEFEKVEEELWNELLAHLLAQYEAHGISVENASEISQAEILARQGRPRSEVLEMALMEAAHLNQSALEFLRYAQSGENPWLHPGIPAVTLIFQMLANEGSEQGILENGRALVFGLGREKDLLTGLDVLGTCELPEETVLRGAALVVAANSSLEMAFGVTVFLVDEIKQSRIPDFMVSVSRVLIRQGFSSEAFSGFLMASQFREVSPREDLLFGEFCLMFPYDDRFSALGIESCLDTIENGPPDERSEAALILARGYWEGVLMPAMDRDQLLASIREVAEDSGAPLRYYYGAILVGSEAGD